MNQIVTLKKKSLVRGWTSNLIISLCNHLTKFENSNAKTQSKKKEPDVHSALIY